MFKNKHFGTIINLLSLCQFFAFFDIPFSLKETEKTERVTTQLKKKNITHKYRKSLFDLKQIQQRTFSRASNWETSSCWGERKWTVSEKAFLILLLKLPAQPSTRSGYSAPTRGPSGVSSRFEVTVCIKLFALNLNDAHVHTCISAKLFPLSTSSSSLFWICSATTTKEHVGAQQGSSLAHLMKRLPSYNRVLKLLTNQNAGSSYNDLSSLVCSCSN